MTCIYCKLGASKSHVWDLLIGDHKVKFVFIGEQYCELFSRQSSYNSINSFYNVFLHQKSFRDSLTSPEFVLTDFGKMDRPGQLHLGYVVS